MKKYTTVFLALILVFSCFCAYAAFDDIDEGTSSWAGDAIHSLADAGIINGYVDGTFRPDADVTRAEFAKMITAAFELGKSDVAYEDTSFHWAVEYINSLGGLMYCEGSNFEPDKKASRADIAYCVAGVLNLQSKDKEFVKQYSDYSNIPDEMLSKVSASAENGIMTGYEDLTLRPLANVSRAEAAVIVYRALNFSSDVPYAPPVPDTPVNPGEHTAPPVPDDSDIQIIPITPPSSEQPGDSTSVPDVPVEPQMPENTKDHLYNLYPGKDIILLISVNQSVDVRNGEDAYKLTYKLANDNTVYTSVVPWDTPVAGIKSDIQQLSGGDVMIMNTAFLGHIGNLYVLASFENGAFVFDHKVTGYGKGHYTIAGGRIKNLKQAGRNTVVTLEANGVENTVYVPNGFEADVFSSWKKGDKWSYGSIYDVDYETETEYAFVRMTDGAVTDVIVSDFNR